MLIKGNMTATITFNNDFEMTSYSVDPSGDAARLALDYVEYLENLTTIKLVNSYQNLENFNFIYLFRNADGKFKVEADQDGNLLTTVNEDIKAEVEEAVSENLLEEYIVGAGTEANSIVVKTKGYRNNPALELNHL